MHFVEMHANHKILFEPLALGPVVTQNRFYQVPHGPGAGNLPQVDLGIRGARAEGGWGVVCTENCAIHPSSDANFFGIRRLWNDSHIAESAITADEIHKHGALAGIELAHNGMVASNFVSREPVWGPSSQIALGSIDAFRCMAHAMDRKAIKSLLSWQRTAALRARTAGFDVVYVYSAHNLALPQHFLSPRYNRRTDEYGGSLENRARLLREMIEVTKDAVGATCAVAVRLSVDELMGLDGITADREGRQVVELLAELPDVWDVNVSDWANDSRSSRFAKEGWQEEYVSFVKKCTSKPVVGVGRFTSPDTMASQIRRGILDLIGAARPTIADPFLPRKVAEGRTEDIRECIGCNYCIKTVNHAVVAGCTQNPTMGQEWRLGWHPERIAPKASDASILVIGAGPAGLEAARAIAQRGYRVALADADRQLGGRVRRESTLPGLQEWSRVADWRITQLLKLPNVTVYADNCLSADQVVNLDYQHVVVATGSRWRRDGVGESNRTPVTIHPQARILTPDDLMNGVFPDAGPVVIFDDDHYYMGGVLAELLRIRGLPLTLVTPGHTLSKNTEDSLEAPAVLQRLRELHVKVAVQWNLVRIGLGDVTVQSLISGELMTFEAATVVLVTSREPVDTLYQELTARGAIADSGIKSVTLVGDANSPSTIAAAVYDGHRCARELEAETVDFATLPPSSRTLY